MTQPNVSGPSAHGAVDLSATVPPSAEASTAVTGSYVVEVTEQNFESVVRLSIQHPVVLEFYSPRAPEQARSSADLAGLAQSAAGGWLLGRINVDTVPQIAASLQINAVPTVIGVLSGQLVPLWQGSLGKAEMESYLGQLLKLAVANGVIGKAKPVSAPEAEEDPAADPKYDAAFEAMGQGDYATALTEFMRILEADPTDAIAKAGKAQSGLMSRISTVLDPGPLVAAADQPGASPQAITLAADLEVATGKLAEGFARLVAAIRESAGDDRDVLRKHLLELFDTQDPADPAVLTARRDLATALF
ncbi:MAG: tetratricopeptide repeat protein [Propionibacteriaceae bacterium]|jgi:putative thioredoxin|nr:tetratricopeptide repeat protein [Propionibacteriaceae bacterium]